MDTNNDGIFGVISTLNDKLSEIQTDIVFIKTKNSNIESDLKEIKEDTREARDKSREALSKYNTMSKNWLVILPLILTIIGYMIYSYVDISKLDENMKVNIANNKELYKEIEEEFVEQRRDILSKCGRNYNGDQ